MGSQREPAKELADILRSKHGIEAHTAIAEGLRVEYIRGQDFVAYAQAHPEQFDRFCRGKPLAEQVKEVSELLLRRGLLRRCDHMYKKPPPGKKLAKYPRKLVFFEGVEALTFGEDSFYAWTFERPTSPWVYAGAALAVVGALLATLFPLAPYGVKVAVLYVSAGLLSLIVAIITLRALLAAISWVLTGKAVWFLPNILAEVPLNEIFTPWVSVEASEPGSWGSRPVTRLGVGAALGAILYLLYTNAPDKGRVVSEASRYRDEIFDLLNVHKEGYQRIAGNATAGNATASNGTAGSEAEAGAGAGSPMPEAEAAAAEQPADSTEERSAAAAEAEQPAAVEVPEAAPGWEEEQPQGEAASPAAAEEAASAEASGEEGPAAAEPAVEEVPADAQGEESNGDEL